MTEQDALLEAIFASPRDDTPRLVYADWLDEHGEGLHAEFIRVQIAREKITTKAAQRDKLLKQETAVWRKLARRWADLFEGWKAQKGEFSRGFHNGTVDGEATLGGDDFATCSPRWWPWLPIRRVWLSAVDQFPDELLDCDHLRRLTRLRLFKVSPHEHSIAEEFVVRLFGSTRFERLAELDVSLLALSRATADAMRAAPFLDNLKRLGVAYYALGHSAWMLFPDTAAYNRQPLPRVKPGVIAAALRERLDGLAGNLLVVQPGETSWRAMLAFTRGAPT